MRQHNYEEVGKLGVTRLNLLLEALVVDHVGRRLCHGDIPELFLDMMAEYYPQWNLRTHRQFKKDLLLDIEETLEFYIKDMLPKYSWNIWSSQLIGRDLLLTVGEDFRIKEYHRLTGR